MSERVQTDSRGAITASTRPAERVQGGFCVSMDDAMNNQKSIYFNTVGERKPLKRD